MQKEKLFASAVVVLLAFAAVLPAAAQTAPAAAEASAEAGAPVKTEAAVPAQTLPMVPKLSISWACGECEKNEKVPPLIEAAYAAEAKKHAMAVSDTDVAEVTITDIRQRPPGIRVAFGIFAGKDRLGLRIRYKDQEYTVSDYSANVMQGLNHLCESVGKLALESISKKRS
jgi:hypothetical protein